ALPGAKFLKKFEQNLLLFRIKSAHTLPLAAEPLIAPPRMWGLELKAIPSLYPVANFIVVKVKVYKLLPAKIMPG
ncbi:MAG: hypothetical protein KAW12_11645, partial [Candidatus Aminicenantes bacterium]|nr:hypothetical protein [Candidatus Aminicenantes bacterium]